MKKLCRGCVCALLSLSCALASGCDAAPSPQEVLQASLTVDMGAQKERTVSDSLFGVFLEDINYVSFAMDDDLIANGLFESPLEEHWRAEGGFLLLLGLFKKCLEGGLHPFICLFRRLFILGAHGIIDL